MGYDESNDYPPGTHIIVAWLNEDSCDSYTGYLGEFYQNWCVRSLCDSLIQPAMCIMFSQFVHYFGPQKISKSSTTYAH